ncbi:glycosyltransferase family 1 protein [Escherichia coli]|uniref:glycosyltransferase family 4 protein n=1 Tax=Escherichia coli TaxID=562 RepID=UPI0015D7C83C|nr:glycosyltransferase family 1 protein [Escherichia coli]MBA0964721.1 glycosyltransferase family 4 protein [Escherichia coli]NZB20200.1 glycosyltransferase family 4 protein [Escherichia coli]NZB80107.1 glycosyltransferase family 4 protein [Escherichia coli]NZC21143.1 glycosyltransferase family 4 protein [Escherichia coli]HAV9687595.1 glycosyltransferase family 4 protein [Escherichia coli]
MIIYDGIIEKLQSGGGVTVVFNEIVSRLTEYKYISYDTCSKISIARNNMIKPSRFLERYRDCVIPDYNPEDKAIFHSTYYRLPHHLNIPVITTVHDFTYEKFVGGPAKKIHSWQKNRAIRRSDIIICVSQNTANDLMRYCPVNSSRIRIIYNGVSDEYYPLPEINNVDSQKVLFVGARGGYKNFELAIDAVASVAGLELHIVGGGDLTTQEKIKLESKLSGRYFWLGKLTNQELNIAYNSSYALLYPSSYEGFGIPIIEAMRAGCPVIAANSSSIPEVAGDAAILVDDLNISTLREAILSIPACRNELISAGFTQSRKFSWERCFQETLLAYNELL